MTKTNMQKFHLRHRWWKLTKRSIKPSYIYFIWSEILVLYQFILNWYKTTRSYKRYTEWVDPDLKVIRKRMKYILRDEKGMFDGKKKNHIVIDFEKLAERGIIALEKVAA